MHFVFIGNLLFWSHHQWKTLVLNQKSFGPHYCCCRLVVLSYSSHFLTKISRELLIPTFSCIWTGTLYLSCFLSFFKNKSILISIENLTSVFLIYPLHFCSLIWHICFIYLSFRSKSFQDNCESPLVTLSQLLVVMFNYFCSKIYTTDNKTETSDLKIWYFYQGENIMNKKERMIIWQGKMLLFYWELRK